MKELLLVVNYRRIFQIAFKQDKCTHSTVIIDYSKSYSFYESDLKPVLMVSHADALAMAIDDILSGRI